MRSQALLVWLVLSLLPIAVRGQATVEVAQCQAQPPAGYEANCGYVALPQDYAAPAKGAVAIYFTQILAAADENKPDPLVYLVGGPGSSGSQLLATSFRKYLSAFAGERDIIIIDQRGTGFSDPPLYCREALHRLDEILQSHHAGHAELMLEILKDCHARLKASGVRLETYHSENNARDIVNVLLALGYERWNLVGVSYGSRLALAIMRDHPQYLRSVILDSVYPPQADIYVDAYYHGERALQALFQACAASERCGARFPDLESVFYRLFERLNQAPLMAKANSPVSKKALEIEISGYRLYDWVFSWLYEVNAIRRIPQLIYDLHRGNAGDAARIGAAYEANMISLSLGMHYTVQCQEEYGVSEYRDYASVLAAHPHLSGFMRYPVEGAATLPRLCAIWQAEARPPRANRPVVSDVPALLLSGNFDPITPPAYADMAFETLATATKFVLPHVGHGVLRSHRCAVDIAIDFINEPFSEPDSSCIAETREIEFE